MAINNHIVQKQIAAVQLSMLRYRITCCERRHRKIGVRDIFKMRPKYGDGYHLINEMRFGDEEMFFNYTRMNKNMFDQLLNMVGPRLKKREMKTKITEVQRLCITLRFLAAGDCLATLSFAYRCARSTVSVILKETLAIIAEILEPRYLKPPSHWEEWVKIEQDFATKWNLPHCVGAIDGKHINIQAPQASGSLYFNYKKTFSLVLLAVCDANYCFIITDIGTEGSQSDAAIFRESVFGKKLRNKSLRLPSASVLPNSNTSFPYFFVGDAAFPLKENLLKPFSVRNLTVIEAVYNYRLSRARRVVENSFGILAARWRILRRPFNASLGNSHNIIRCVVSLHNYIKKSDSSLYCPPNFVDTDEESGNVLPGEWRNIVHGDDMAMSSCSSLGSRNPTRAVIQQRELFAEYLCGAGKVPWQIQKVKSGFWGATIRSN